MQLAGVDNSLIKMQIIEQKSIVADMISDWKG